MGVGHREVLGDGDLGERGRRGQALGVERALEDDVLEADDALSRDDLVEALEAVADLADEAVAEIGRASCRERV